MFYFSYLKWISAKMMYYWWTIVLTMGAPISFVKVVTQILPVEGGVREGVHKSIKAAVRGCFFAKTRSAISQAVYTFIIFDFL